MSQHKVAQQLNQLIAQYGPQLAEDPRRTGALLRDLCAPYKREVRVLSAVAEEGLAKELMRDDGKTSATILLPRLAGQLHDDLGIDEGLALWAIVAWAEALGWTVPPLNYATTEPASAQPGFSSSQKPPAQHEGETRPRIGQSGRYLDNGDGTVTDPETGLQWMRCSLGQEWDGQTCVGEGKDKMTWQDALDAAKEVNRRGGYAGYRDWRVPTIEELNSLVYCSSGKPGYFPFVGSRDHRGCEGDDQMPTIDLEAFPEAFPEEWQWHQFWSASPYAGSSGLAWSVSFRTGDGHWSAKSTSRTVRLVRGGQ
ncbi:DUF1566 domain-containing protein [Thioalkalivibrio sp. ALE11]|uniref:Lcl C-terminal domain-containing protein n=1 Tax=Thioalkalivibrio sp. ALE11 TaxID=1265494 RepID=UPI00035F1668|nr:DUF1566 domain-containing protein [Thioalkalivibrio sp. ALE11]